MWLENDDAARTGDGRVPGAILPGNRAQCGQGGRYLGRVMGVVVEDPHSVGCADQFETPAHTLEPGQPVQHLIGRRARLDGGQDRSQRVERHVPAGHRQPHRPRLDLPGELDVGHRTGSLLLPTEQRAGQSLGRSAAVAQDPDSLPRAAIGEGGRARVIGADHQRSVR